MMKNIRIGNNAHGNTFIGDIKDVKIDDNCQGNFVAGNLENAEIGKNFKDNVLINEDKSDTEDFTDSLIHVSQKLQETKKYYGAIEDERNQFIIKMLSERRKDLVFKDQTQRGSSESGKNSGNIDMYVEKNNGNIFCIIEALILDSVDENNIIRHINKLFKYDTSGLPINYILIYYTGKNFSKFLFRYTEFLNKVKIKYPTKNIENLRTNFSEIKTINMKYQRNSNSCTSIHLCINMPEN